MSNYVYPVTPDSMFGVYSDMLDIDYMVEVDNSKYLEEAKEITDKALQKWAEAEDDSEEWYKGFVEIVKDSLKEAEIAAKFYTRME